MKLFNTEGKLGIFCIFQDLSVRTEGFFRLKFMFADLTQSLNRGIPSNSAAYEGPVRDSQIEAEVFSDVFGVFAPKNFPGMLEATELSQCFARQGVKITTRKDVTKLQRNQLNQDEDEYDDG